MPKIIFRIENSADQEVDVPVGWSVMEGAIKNGIEGILGECGGGCACATCHIYVAEEWTAKIAPASGMEDDMLDCTAMERNAASRLSCQLKVSAELDGLVVSIPLRQV
ncbi:MAG: 2Fe-2S iron-sulfur cluster-binding protein [Pseudomonadota bacterium]